MRTLRYWLHQLGMDGEMNRLGPAVMMPVCCEMERLAELKVARRRDVTTGSIAKLLPYGIYRVCQVSNARGCPRSCVVL